jgi:hypothetical protein
MAGKNEERRKNSKMILIYVYEYIKSTVIIVSYGARSQRR